jgi:hypothetical protein
VASFLTTALSDLKDPIFAILFMTLCFSAFFATHFIIPKLIPINIKAGLFGQDIYLKGTPKFEEKIAECLGLAPYVSFATALLSMHTIFSYTKQ